MKKWFVAIGLITLPIGAFFFWGGIEGRWLKGLALMLLSALVVVQGIVLVLWGLALREDKNERRSSNKVLLLIIPIIAASMLFPYFLVKPLGVNVFGIRFEKSIIRNTSSSGEETALTIAEDFDYSRIFNLQRYATLGHARDPWPYTWANFIDTQVIEYYDDRFDNLKGEAGLIEFRYEANVSTWNQIRLVYTSLHLYVRSLDDDVLYETLEFPLPALDILKSVYRNDTSYQAVSGIINFTMPMGYIVEMNLEYSEVWAPLAAFTSDVRQIIVVDEDFTPILLCVQSLGSIS